MVVYGPLAQVAVAATTAIVALSILVTPYNAALVNLVAVVCITSAMVVYSCLIGISLLELPAFLWQIVFDSSHSRSVLYGIKGSILITHDFAFLCTIEENVRHT
ncbi:unnamed protein product [Nippostrongylus brasiliensis]|uniref:Aa_trans domain-containing protein n=1 Tax=Nippostrongylus brasiliensis TaxID=27835 RepID=A0A0N4YRZ0_NIPBR|nr:unnamed protein product [Nippostrongylus brasiliensis]